MNKEILIQQNMIEAQAILDMAFTHHFIAEQKAICYNILDDWNGEDLEVLAKASMMSQIVTNFEMALKNAVATGLEQHKETKRRENKS